MTRILVIGETGQVARELARRGPAWAHEVRNVPRSVFDLASPVNADALLQAHAPDIVINAAAYTAVDAAEADAATAFAVNRDGPGALAAACARADIPFFHLSTDYVFDGSGTRPYREEDATGPINIYGQSKLEGEIRVKAATDKHLILRTSWIHASHGKNFVRTLLRLGREREILRVVDDQIGSPTAAADIADALHGLADRTSRLAWGVYHFCGQGQATWYEVARAIFEEAGDSYDPPPELVPIASEDYPTPAPRPRYSVLDCGRGERMLGLSPRPWRDQLADTVRDLRHEFAKDR